MVGTGTRVPVGGPWFEDLEVGRVFDDAPAVTITEGLAAWHQAVTGDRLRLPLDAGLCAAVTGRPERLAHPMLVTNVAIGQSTQPSQRVLGNLFYRGLVLRRPVHIGDTLRTRTEVVAARQNRPKPGRAAAGTVALRVTTENQHGDTVLDFWRAPMVPLREASAETGRADDLAAVGAEVDLDTIRSAAPRWDLAPLRTGRGPRATELEAGTVFEVEAHDTVTCAPELARLTLNLARTHTDAHAGAYGRRLVYGGHTIALAFALCLRALPDIATILAWRGCDHTGPVFEEDAVAVEVAVDELHPVEGGAAVADLRLRAHARRGPGAPDGAGDGEVLDWRLSVLMP